MKSVTETKIVNTVLELREWRRSVPGERVGLVPTMGALHEGHLALIRRAASQSREVVVSIFVNPLQFGPQEDFSRYPRTFEKDVALCRQAGASLVFHPAVEEMYPGGQAAVTRVVPPDELTEKLCGLFRPGHFTGVATVVTKLLSMVQPDLAFFGEKDYQQLTVIRALVADLNLPLEVVPVPTVREEDGLAMSSRNTYLSRDERQKAPQLYRSLCSVKNQCEAGTPLAKAVERARRQLTEDHGFAVQYLEACEPDRLEPLRDWRTPAVILVAAKLGSVRLIDNLIVS